MKKFIFFLILILIIVGCKNETKPVVKNESNQDYDLSIEASDENTNTDTNMNSLYNKLNRKFKETAPDAQIINKKMFDMANDGIEELVIIFDTYKKMQTSP